MLNDPIARAIAVKRNVDASAIDDEDNPRKDWEGKLLGHRSVQLRLKLNDDVMVLRHLALMEEEIRATRAAAVKVDGLSRLLLVRSRMHRLGLKLNAKRWSE